MELVNTKEMFKKAHKEGYAIGAFNIDNFETCEAVLKAAQLEKSPVIIAVSEGARNFIGHHNVRPMVESLAKQLNIPIALHLDHGKSIETCKECIDQGYTSVMIDASHLPIEENIRITKQVVEYAHPRGVSVEAELGVISGIEDELIVSDKYGKFTHPSDVERFVKETNCDSLAIAIGTAHGAHKFKPGQKPMLRFDILEEIRELLPEFPLVLHGASSVPQELVETINKYGGNMEAAIGIPEELLRKAIKLGVNKINVGTDIRVAYLAGFRKALHEKPHLFDLKAFVSPAKDEVTKLVSYKISNIFGSSQKA